MTISRRQRSRSGADTEDLLCASRRHNLFPLILNLLTYLPFSVREVMGYISGSRLRGLKMMEWCSAPDLLTLLPLHHMPWPTGAQVTSEQKSFSPRWLM